MRYFSIINCFVLLIITGFLTACTQGGSSPVSEPDATSKEAQVIPVAVTEVQSAPFFLSIQSRGVLRASRWVDLSFPQSGILRQLYVKNTQRLKQGQLIAMLENTPQQIALEEARVQLDNALSLYENELLTAGDSLIYKDNWARVKEKLRLRTGVPSAEVAVKRASFDLSQTYVYAPYDGLIEGMMVQVGNLVQPSQVIGTLLDDQYFEGWLEVLEFEAGRINKGTEVTLRPLAYPDKAFHATVVEINPRIGENGYMLIKCRLPFTPGLYDGMSVSGEINVLVGERLSVPKSAIVKKGDRHVVFTLENELAKWNYVVLGEENGSKVAVLEGVSKGKKVIYTNSFQLSHDAPVVLDQTDLE